MRKQDVAQYNRAHYPWRIEKAPIGNRGFVTLARNVASGEVIYRCEGWSQDSRRLAMQAILERKGIVQ